MKNQKPVKFGFTVGFQIKYCLTIAVFFICATLLLYLFLNKALSGSYLESLRTLYYLDQNLPFYLSIMALLLLLFLLILTLVITLLVSHQIAGPVYRFEEVIRQLISGTFPRQVATRRTDQLKSMVTSLNLLSSRCRGTFEKVGTLSGLIDESSTGDEMSEQTVLTLTQRIAEIRQDTKCHNDHEAAE